MWSSTAGLAALAVVATSLVACGDRSPEAGVACLPPSLQVSTTRVHAGDSLTLSSGPFGCSRIYPAGKTYSVMLGQGDGLGPLPLGNVPVDRDGSFGAIIRIPSRAVAGTSYLVVMGSPYDECDDEGGSCADYQVDIRVLDTRHAERATRAAVGPRDAVPGRRPRAA